MDIVKILQVGFSGFAFLLLFLAYRLLGRLDTTHPIGEQHAALLRFFMITSVVFALLGLTSSIGESFTSPNVSTPIFIAKVNSREDIAPGRAAVCGDSRFISRYILLSSSQGKRLLQVLASSISPCNGENLIEISAKDLVLLGEISGDVKAAVAQSGFKFETGEAL